MGVHVLMVVAAIWTVAAIIPGPNFFITVHTAVGDGRNLSFFTVLGIVTGTLIWAVSGYLGISLLFETVPMLYLLLKAAGGLYLIYVGINLIRGKRTSGQKSRCSPLATGCFRLGLLTNLLNPKTAAFMTSLFAATIPSQPTMELGIAVVAVICSISAFWYLLVATLFSRDLAKRVYSQLKWKIEKIAGLIFTGFGLKLALYE